MRKRALHSSLIVCALLGALLSTARAVAQPVAVNDSYMATEDTRLSVNAASGVRANDIGAGGNNVDAIVLAAPTRGVLSLSSNGNGDFTYTPNPNLNGIDTFTYRLRYSTNQFSNAATVTINVAAVNDAPTAVANVFATAEDVPLVVAAPGILANDTDIDSTALTAVLVTSVAPSSGTLSPITNGGFTYTPASGFSGTATFTYRAVDNATPPLQSAAAATVTITVTSVNDPPVANANTYAATEDTVFNVAAPGVLANDTDPDPGTVLTAVVVTPPSSGTLSSITNGGFTYTPALNFFGPVTFTYNARDNATPPASSAAPATVTINVAAVNDAPTAVADVFAATENVPLVVAAPGILANDTDVDSTALTAVLVTSVAPTSGTLSPITNGGFTYTPAAGFSGTATFTYRAVDNATPPLQSAAVATVTITVTGANDPPVANADTYAATEDTVLNVAAPGVLANDTDPDPGSVLTALLVAPPTHGTLTLSPNGSFSYSPAPDYQGADSFRYRARDNGTPPLQSGEATVTLNVASANDAPRFVTGMTAIPPQTATQNLPFTLSLAPLFVDPEASPLTFAVTGLPAGLTFTSAGVISGTPTIAVTGPFAVNVVVSDGQSPFAAPPFTITVVAAGRTDLALSAAVTPSPALINQPITWTFTVENRSPVENVANLSLQTVFTGPPSFAITPSTRCVITPESARTTVACTAGPVLANGRATITLNGSSAQAGDVIATATVAITDAAPIDATPDNNTTTTVVNVAQTLAAGPAQTLPATGLRASASGDFNADGFIDLAVAAESGGTLIYANVAVTTPPGSTKRELATQPIPLGDTGPSTGIAVADFNGDGSLDLVVAKSAGPSVVLRNPNDGTFAFTAVANALGVATGASNAVAARDLNGDGRVDIVLGTSAGNRVFMNQANGTFTAGAALGNDDSRDVVLADLAGDAALELVFANANRGATVYTFNSATGQYQQTVWPTGAATSVAAADFDGNGRIDLVFGGSLSKVVLFNATAAGAPPLFALPLELGNTATIDVVVTDPEADGDMDVVGINASGSHQVFANNGVGQFTLRPQQFASRDSRNAAAAKLSVDDRVDVAVIGASSLDVFHNDGAGNFGVGDAAAPTIQLRGEASVELTVESTYTDAGATATDAVDGDLTTRIRVDNPVNTAVVGTYTVTYNVGDNSGNAAATVTRTVRVGVRAGTGGGGGGSFDLICLLALAGFTVLAAVRPLANRGIVQ